ncbi:MAG: hypothetical protein HZA22_09905 [Nitrospirae bacterium]|nr:hypothetical protein [Nitrospirota bacterium]
MPIPKLINLLPLFVLLALAACNPYGYGPARDYSKFVSAKLIGDGQKVVFTAKLLAYRPATGWNAFPDGGIPKYVRDEDVLGIYDMETREARIVVRRENEEWQPGQGEYFVSHISGDKAVVTEGGQRRDDYMSDYRMSMFDVDTGEFTPLPLKEELARRGLGMGYFYLLNGDGDILIVARPLMKAAGKEPPKTDDNAPQEFWLRSPGGGFTHVGRDGDYNGFEGGEVFFYSFGERRVFATDVKTGVVRDAGRYTPPMQPDAVRDVRIGFTGQPGTGSLEVWVKRGESWEFSERLMELGEIK